jgi:hypothetical protein
MVQEEGRWGPWVFQSSMCAGAWGRFPQGVADGVSVSLSFSFSLLLSLFPHWSHTNKHNRKISLRDSQAVVNQVKTHWSPGLKLGPCSWARTRNGGRGNRIWRSEQHIRISRRVTCGSPCGPAGWRVWPAQSGHLYFWISTPVGKALREAPETGVRWLSV